MNNSYNGIVIFGEMGSGKDTLAEQISNLRTNAHIYNMGALCREIMNIAKVNPKWVDNERSLGQDIADKLREVDKNIFGDYILSKIFLRWQEKYGFNCGYISGDEYNGKVLNHLSKIRKNELSIISGGRTIDDFRYWKEKKYLIVGIKISDRVRLNRLTLRDGESMAKNSDSNHNTETDAKYIVENFCDEIIINDGTLDDLKNDVEKILNTYNF
ncbi:AAA family ATPase [Clostridium beijerinckii]|uniref:AAA family ATPase n=1 Tax=Clostridium beijerinckii TaxID=1520 RepID=UPI0003D37D09|nr:AAA family ATPase [Clostridium beijerinckii]ALB45988.1 hypothetical protein X276_12385 [Clostridium beijerinckii NRRL B-598]